MAVCLGFNLLVSQILSFVTVQDKNNTERIQHPQQERKYSKSRNKHSLGFMHLRKTKAGRSHFCQQQQQANISMHKSLWDVMCVVGKLRADLAQKDSWLYVLANLFSADSYNARSCMKPK